MSKKDIKIKTIEVKSVAQQAHEKIKHKQEHDLSHKEFVQILALTLGLVALRGAALGSISGALGASFLKIFNSDYQIRNTVTAGAVGSAAVMVPLVLLKSFYPEIFLDGDQEYSSCTKFKVSLGISALVGIVGRAIMYADDPQCLMTATQFALALALGTALCKGLNLSVGYCLKKS